MSGKLELQDMAGMCDEIPRQHRICLNKRHLYRLVRIEERIDPMLADVVK